MRQIRNMIVLMVLCSLGFSVISAQDAETPESICSAAGNSEPETREYAEPEQVLEDGVDYHAIFCTDAGAVYIDLYEGRTPVTVNNFVFLAENGYYNNTIFHRVLEGFMAQGGDPTGTGTGGPGYQFEDEVMPSITFSRPGLLAMANAGPATNGSQFFITTVPTPHLNGRHTIFGSVLTGQANVLDMMIRDPQVAPPDAPATMLETVVIVTEPETVTYEPSASATPEEITAILDEARASLPAELLTLESVVLNAEEIVAAAPESIQSDLETLLAENGHQYRVESTLSNAVCDVAQIPFVSVGYTLDAFGTVAEAQIALGDPVMTDMLLEAGFGEPILMEETGMNVFQMDVTECDVESVYAVAMWQQSEYVVTASIIIPADDENLAFIDQVLRDFVGAQIYEPLFAPIFWASIQ